MSSFVPDPLDDCPPPLGEESHPEHPQDARETNLVVIIEVVINTTLYFVITLLFRFAARSVPDPPDDAPSPGDEPSHPELPQDPRDTHLSGIQCVAITAVRATGLTLGLRRIPAGFHVTVQADGVEWQTSNKLVHVDQDIIEWDERMLLPFEPSSKIPYSVMENSFRTFEISVGELLDRSEKSHPIVFQPKLGEVVSSCTSLFIMVEQRSSDENDIAVFRPLTTLTTGDMHTLLLKTDAGHRLLARYCRTQNSKDLDQSIKHFERASELCPVDHPYRPAALSNLAAAKYVSCQVNGTYLDLDIPISLFQDTIDLRPTGHPDRPVTQLHLAIALLSRFAKRGFQTDADAAEELLTEVLDVCLANSHVRRAALLAIETSSLHHPARSTDANALRAEEPIASTLPWSPDELGRRVNLCLQRDDPLALDEVISLHYNALEYYSGTHYCRGQLLDHLGIALHTRFERRGNNQDLDNAIALFREALALHPVGHSDRSASLGNLANSLFTRFEQRGNDQDLDEDIALHREALDLFPVGDTQRSVSLNNLARGLSTRFKHRGNSQDLDKAIALLRETLALHPVGHPQRSMSLNNFAAVLFARFEQRGNVRDLDEAIALHREALALYLVGHPHRSISLNNLANGLATRFKHRGNRQDLDKAIALLREALALHPVGHLERSTSLNHLANQLSTRFEQRGNVQDLNEAIALLREALDLHTVGHTYRAMSLNNLAKQLSTCFEQRGNVRDLDEAIVLHREALALRPVGHTDRSISLSNLANQLSIRFEQRGSDQDLDEAIVLHREGLALCPVGHPHRSASLNNLASGLSTRSEHRFNDQDLDEAILLHREALALRPVGHADRSRSLNNLAKQLSTRFEQRGSDQDLDEAIALDREALALCPVGHPDRSRSLNNLANQLSTRFHYRGNDQDLDEAIVHTRGALTLYPVGHPQRSMSLNNLAKQLSTRFEQRGSDQDLDEAIALDREALALRPVGHLYRSASLNNLANTLSIRFHYQGNDQDLDEAVTLLREALALRPFGHRHRSVSLNNLANQLSIRFRQRSNDQDLDEAIILHGEALALRPVGHPDRSTSLTNVANLHFYQGKHQDFDEAVTLFREALALDLLVGHSHKAVSLSSLAVALSARLENGGNDQDLDEAIALNRQALTLRPVGHPDRWNSLYNLASVLSARFEHQGNTQDLNESLANLRCALTLLTRHNPGLDGTGEDSNLNAAMHHLKAAANVVSGGLLSRLQISLLWVHRAGEYTHSTLLEAYATSMNLLDVYMSATASVSSRHDAMKVFPSTLAADAASCALRSGDLRRAVELLEQGRTLIWTQMARFRTPIDSLQERGDHAQALMKKFRDLSSLLDTPSVNHPEGTLRVNVEAEAIRYTRLVKDWNKAVEEIRKIEGFSHFLLPPSFSELQDAAHEGPIVMLVASESSCDAIIIPRKQPPTSIQLPTNLEHLVRLVNALQQTVVQEAGPRGTQPGLTKVLRELWDDVVRPVVENLDQFARRGSRIWWCPTSFFNFLPLHAAGEYKRGGKSLSQLYVSSYTPSLTALIRARKRNDGSPSVSFAAIGQNHPPGHSFPLEAVEPELELVQSLLPPPPTVFFTKVTSIESTKSRVLHTLQDNHWLHFACHGTQNLAEPFKSAFLMRDQPLSLLDIAQTHLSRHEFAFLSACETAVGDFKTPDEVIHLAAGLQFAGVKSVIGTLWRVNDTTVRRLVEAFYHNFCDDGKMDSRRAARALHRAVQMLACDTDMPLDQRIVFMHIGL
ncbi:CHAT domain-containing protein [Suillus ampliporus]|nr:CHAT domain-containing protein [Suillus ampliporus]